MKAKRAFTLVELLVVMAIIMILVGAGVTAFIVLRTNMRVAGTASQVDSALRQARNASILQRAPSVVTFDLTRKQVYAIVRSTVGLWHFEEVNAGRTPGAFYQDAFLRPGSTLDLDLPRFDGKFGRCLDFDGDTLEYVTATGADDGTAGAVGDMASFDLRDGVSIAAWIMPRLSDPEGELIADGTVLPVLSKTSDDGTAAYALALIYRELLGSFSLYGTVRTRVDGGSYDDAYSISAAQIRPDVWTAVAMSFRVGDEAVELVVNNIPRTPDPLTPDGTLGEGYDGSLAAAGDELIAAAGPVRIGKWNESLFYGKIDEVKLAGYISGERYKLPDDIDVEVLRSQGQLYLSPSRDQASVYFDSQGHLDSGKHGSSEVVVKLRYKTVKEHDMYRHNLAVGRMGTVHKYLGD